jgi:hypothetical protein
MIFDSQNLFSDNQAITGGAGTTVSTNVIDRNALGIPKHAEVAYKSDLGKGTKIPLRIQMTADAAGGTSLQAQVQVSVDEAFTSPIIVAQTAAIPLASLVAGYVFPLDYIPLKTDERYIRIAYVRVGTFTTGGTVTAGVTMGNDERHGV